MSGIALYEVDSEEDARAAVAAVEVWLAAQADIEGTSRRRREPEKTAKLAVSFASDLLDAARCDGLGGCPFCRG